LVYTYGMESKKIFTDKEIQFMRNELVINSAQEQMEDAHQLAVFASEGEKDAEDIYLATLYHYSRKENRKELQTAMRRLSNGGNA